LLFGSNRKIDLTLGYEHPDFEKIKAAADKEKEN
jgi:hypothetical protein